MNNIVAIVVTYNRKELLIQCIERLEQQTCPLDIMVIDNASTDGTDKIFENVREHIIYCNTGSNLGGAGGFSYGIKKAIEYGYEYLWILDDDTMPTMTALEYFLIKNKELKGKYGFLSSKVLWKDGTLCTMNKQKRTKWKRIQNFDKSQSVQYASFVSLFIKAEIVKRIGLPYKEFFIWADDWEYTRRISKQEKSYFVPDSLVYHCCNSNIGADIMNTSAERMDRFKYMYRNDVVMYRQDKLEGYLYLFIRNIVHMIRILQKAENKVEKIKLIFKATSEGIRFRPQIEYPSN